MSTLRLALVAVSAVGALAASDEFGPAAFWWPADRVWAAHMDNTAPCGSADGVGTRTKFPLTGGRISVTAKDDSYDTFISVSFMNDPRSQADFNTLRQLPITEVDPGHSCIPVPDPPTGTAPGTNATLQLRYTADFDRPENQTFYACADITYVSAAEVDFDDIPCFNATSPTDVPAPTATGIPTNSPGHDEDGPPLSTGTPSSGGNSLSKGAIAGIVIGSLVGVALIFGLGLLFYRERQRKNRLIQQRDSGRGVPWVEDPAKDSVSAGSFNLASVGPAAK
ncbi:hypothetical protein B0T16DRAFT_101754 [Cercophora newfieldiana]|uniref:Copper acquisition factor BIM1-like domain-containing protein n=1 Tax=Cercophora newfieldiana TaxID=92897 RepID=A0AA39YGY6_9PEZI|nr:hypothetical protein B0T16DRAFT_101754 [Cercophora newfieldiana]